MEDTIRLFCFIVRQGGGRISANFRKFLLTKEWDWKEFVKWLIVEQLAVNVYSLLYNLVRSYSRMQIVDIPGEIRIAELPDVDYFAPIYKPDFVDSDFSQKNIIWRSRSPKAGRYKAVCFNNSADEVSMLEVAIIALFRFWKPVNVYELLSVSAGLDSKTVGFRGNYGLGALGVIIRRSSSPLSFGFPYIIFEPTGGKSKPKMTLEIHDFPDNYPSGQHILFRVS